MSTNRSDGMVAIADIAANVADEIELIDLVVRGLCQFSDNSEIDPEQFEPMLMQLRRTIQMARVLERQTASASLTERDALWERHKAEAHMSAPTSPSAFALVRDCVPPSVGRDSE